MEGNNKKEMINSLLICKLLDLEDTSTLIYDKKQIRIYPS